MCAKKSLYSRYPLVFKADDRGRVEIKQLKVSGLFALCLLHAIFAVKAFNIRHVAKIILESDEISPELAQGSDTLLLVDQCHQVEWLAEVVRRNVLQGGTRYLAPQAINF